MTALLLFNSCATRPVSSFGEGVPERPAPAPPPERPAVPENILGAGRLAPGEMAAFLRLANPAVNADFAGELARLYIEEARAEGVNHDAAFAQMCLETGFLRFGNLVTPEMNNFCGLGAIGPGQPGETFPDPRTGVRAHIQHLKAYATEEPPARTLVDPRYFLVRRGSSPHIDGMSGTWAADTSYGGKIKAILQRLYTFSFG